MAYPKRSWEIIPECNDEITGEPRCWAAASTEDDGAKHFIWISQYDDKEFIVEDSAGFNRADKVFKTLGGAKRAAEGILWRQEETGFYTD